MLRIYSGLIIPLNQNSNTKRSTLISDTLTVFGMVLKQVKMVCLMQNWLLSIDYRWVISHEQILKVKPCELNNHLRVRLSTAMYQHLFIYVAVRMIALQCLCFWQTSWNCFSTDIVPYLLHYYRLKSHSVLSHLFFYVYMAYILGWHFVTAYHLLLGLGIWHLLWWILFVMQSSNWY